MRAVLVPLLAPMLVVLVATDGFALRDPGVTWGCAPLVYQVNPDGAGPRQVRAVHRAVRSLGEASGRSVRFAGYTDDRRSNGDLGPGDPVLIEFFWPDDAPLAQGFGEPFIVDGRYVGGSVYLHPTLGVARTRRVFRLALHELGHVAGLDHTTDPADVMHPSATAIRWSTADRAGLAASHARCTWQRPVWDKNAA